MKSQKRKKEFLKAGVEIRNGKCLEITSSIVVEKGDIAFNILNTSGFKVVNGFLIVISNWKSLL